MGKYIADTTSIASIYPGFTEPIRRDHSPDSNPNKGTSTWYRLKPVKKGGKAFVLEVSDCFEHKKDVCKSIDRGRITMEITPISVEEVCDDLLKHWVGNIVGLPHGALPGIMKIRGTVPQQEELEQMRAQQQAYMEYYFAEGERIYQSNEGVHKISPKSKMAAEYLGRPTLWSHPAKSTDEVPCRACRKTIAADAYVCSHCGTRLKALPPDLAAFNELVAADAPTA